LIDHGDWRKENVSLIFKKDKKEDPGNYRLASLNMIPGKVTEQLILETRHMKDKVVGVVSMASPRGNHV